MSIIAILYDVLLTNVDNIPHAQTHQLYSTLRIKCIIHDLPRNPFEQTLKTSILRKYERISHRFFQYDTL